RSPSRGTPAEGCTPVGPSLFALPAECWSHWFDGASEPRRARGCVGVTGVGATGACDAAVGDTGGGVPFAALLGGGGTEPAGIWATPGSGRFGACSLGTIVRSCGRLVTGSGRRCRPLSSLRL